MAGFKRILIVDDDLDDIFITKRLLDTGGKLKSVEFVDSGQEALDYLRGEGGFSCIKPEKPNLVFLDLRMRRMDGLETLEKIRQDRRFDDVPIVVLTNSENPVDRIRAYELGAQSYVTKSKDNLLLIKTLIEA